MDLPQPYWVVDRLEASSLKVFDYSVFLIYFCEMITTIPSLKEKEKAKASARHGDGIGEDLLPTSEKKGLHKKD